MVAAAACAGVSPSQPWIAKITAVQPIILLRVKIYGVERVSERGSGWEQWLLGRWVRTAAMGRVEEMVPWKSLASLSVGGSV